MSFAEHRSNGSESGIYSHNIPKTLLTWSSNTYTFESTNKLLETETVYGFQRYLSRCEMHGARRPQNLPTSCQLTHFSRSISLIHVPSSVYKLHIKQHASVGPQLHSLACPMRVRMPPHVVATHLRPKSTNQAINQDHKDARCNNRWNLQHEMSTE